MKKLNELINCPYDIEINSVEDDSRVKSKNYLFCAIKGLTNDGHDYIDNAIENGACAIISEKELTKDVPVIKVDDSNIAMNNILNNFYDKPLDKLKLIGVTGTDGKTTVSTIIYQLINFFDNCGHIGTKTLKCKNFEETQKLTTPIPTDLFDDFNRFVNNDCHYISMEVSSERLGTNRLNGINFDISIFTNITREHLNSHKTMENYVLAKAKLFENMKNNGICIINIDDPYSNDIMNRANGKIITYGLTNKANIYAKNIVIEEQMLTFTICGLDKEYNIISPLTGKFNVYNLLASIIALKELGFDIEKVINMIKYLKPIAGRMEEVKKGQNFKIIVDFAHTANAVSNLIDYAKTIAKGKVIIVLGTGGNRFLGRKTDLGKTVIDKCDYVFLTTYNPRGEEPIDLVNQMLLETDKTKNNYEIILDRKEAIIKAIKSAKKGDIILITGKGREYFQDVKGVKIPYEGDFEIASNYLEEINKIKNK